MRHDGIVTSESIVDKRLDLLKKAGIRCPRYSIPAGLTLRLGSTAQFDYFDITIPFENRSFFDTAAIKTTVLDSIAFFAKWSETNLERSVGELVNTGFNRRSYRVSEMFGNIF